MHQFHAGYILDIIAKEISSYERNKDKHDSDVLKMKGLLKHLSAFDVVFPNHIALQTDYNDLNPVLATLNNIITRGLPTKAPILLEEEIAKILDITTLDNSKKNTKNFIAKDFAISWNTIFDLFHIVEPNLDIQRKEYLGNLGSEEHGEWGFINNQLKDKPFVKQIFQSQRSFATIDKKLGAGRSVDFSFEFPYLYKEIKHDTKKEYVVLNTKGVIFEYDGKHHEGIAYKNYDEYRDIEALDAGFETIRQSSDSRVRNLKIDVILESDIIKRYEINYHRNLELFLREYIILFTPFAIARIQKTLIEVLLSKPNFLNKNTINIAIIERDVPCAALVVNSLKEHFINLNALLVKDSKYILPEINLTIVPNERFKKYNFNDGYKIASNINESDFDIIIDHSILRRSGIYKETSLNFSKSIKIRSSHFIDKSLGSLRRTYCAIPLKYKTLVTKKPDGKWDENAIAKNIKFFMENIFRKTSFREGQLPIIDRALQQLPVIGLLPTGGGKSLTYQLPILMQPGVSIIVDPIKSLMEDQVRVLNNNWIDCCDYINSSLSLTPKKNKLTNFRFGESQMLFLSPERFVMEDFRNLIKNINNKFGLTITYCVIDEAHCVSEWGHDFRDTYLHLGKNAQEFCFTKNIDKKVSLIALTATASFDVLADIERELQIKHTDVANAIVAIENTIRPEQFFRIVKCNSANKLSTLQKDIDNIGSKLEYWNNIELVNKSIKHHVDNYDKRVNQAESYLLTLSENDISLGKMKKEIFPSIVFCATKSNFGQPSENSVCYVYNNIKSDSKGYYFGGIDEDLVAKEAQESFEKFVKGDLSHIVCTKAFGMGIDKEDVRVVYHVNYSSSLESYVQEAGRVGRDQKIAEAVVILNNKEIFKINAKNVFNKEAYLLNDFLRNKDYRKKIRWNFVMALSAESEVDLIQAIDEVQFTEPSVQNQNKIRDFLKQNIKNSNQDREQQDFFFNLNFNGVEYEKQKIYSFFHENEIEKETLVQRFEKSENKFNLIIFNVYKNININDLMNILNINNTPDNKEKTEKSLRFSYNQFDLLLQLEESHLIHLPLDTDIELNFNSILNRSRTSAETGKLLYRMSCIGFLEDYTIDYNQKQRTCTFYKSENIDYYIQNIKEYLLNYLSENTTNEEIKRLENRLEKIDKILDKIIDCLYFLAEFSDKEIIGKRKVATDEIERVFREASLKEDVYEQNIAIKDEIYYYFNAKYARKDYKIGGELFSLLLDSKYGNLSDWSIVEKYTKGLKNEPGIKINNLKHLIGSSRKITRSMTDTELKNEWSLKLIKAFAEYSMNIESYIKEANKSLLEGFTIFYKMKCNNDFKLFKEKFNQYFDILEENLDKDNNLFKNELNLIMHSIMLKVNVERTEELIQKHNNLKQKYNV